tara:strand:+ start:1351 stop:1830 length:480 start_codon:yes stop_codon:yes gene_type:complete
MKKILLLSLLMVFPLAAQNVVYSEDIDEFTDVKDFYLFVYSDDHTNYVQRSLTFACSNNVPMAMVYDDTYTPFRDEVVTFRFDKNTAFSEDFFVYDGNLFNTTIDTVSKLLNQILSSTSGIARSDESEILRFSNLSEMRSEVNKFIRSARNNPSCDLGL